MPAAIFFQGASWGWTNIGVFTAVPAPHRGHINQSDGNQLDGDVCAQFDAHRAGAGRSTTTYTKTLPASSSSLPRDRRRDDSICDLGLWDIRINSFTNVLNLPDDVRVRLRIRSMVGLIPLFAVETLEPEMLAKFPGFQKRLEWFLANRPNLAKLVSHWESPGRGQRRLLCYCAVTG